MKPSAVVGRQEVDIQLISQQQSVVLMQPFDALLRVQSNVDSRIGPLTLTAGTPPGAALPSDFVSHRNW